jgi:AraC family transcriptional regulator
LETKGILLQLFARFVGQESISSLGKNAHFTRISITLQYIHAHFQDELTVKELADLAHLNPDYFSRIFQESVGLRPITYIHQLRIQKAQHLLLFSDLSQDEVAYAVGFSNRTYFAKVFKEHTGHTAGQYRRQGKVV